MVIQSLAPILPYLNIFNTSLSVILNIAPGVSFIKIVKEIEKYNIIPESMLICNLFNGVGWGCYWHLKNNYMPRLCSILCSILSLIYAFLYLFYRLEKNCCKWLLSVLVVCGICVGGGYLCLYVFPIGPFGFGLMIINILMFISPAQNLGKVIKEKQYKLIPIASTLAGAACSGGWLLFGVINQDINCIVPNAIGLVSSIFTACVYVYFKSQAKDKEEEEGQELVEKKDDNQA